MCHTSISNSSSLQPVRYVYVENLTWVILQPNNRVAELSADYLGRSHRTLLIFRRDMKEHPQGRAIELRHQRSPDVDISIGRTGAGAQGQSLLSASFISLPRRCALSRRRSHLTSLLPCTPTPCAQTAA